ncbi:polysaccharide deacetylase family protein [Parapedobacter defluvii]|uniref:polysaccharide deacetylase family protein n=1 Tax=Parapedobacter defluvii TaxID=2045106 RepID=UPI003341DC33
MKSIPRFFRKSTHRLLLAAGALVWSILPLTAQEDIRLLVRGDDMGVSRSINAAAIAAYERGIVRSVEVMVPGAWFEEAAALLNERPDLDVGIHLTLTSEWKHVKWRPLTHCPSITDADGYFLPFVWKNQQLPDAGSITERNWNIEEIERELRAQIELALKKIPHISHLSEHMGCLRFSEETKQLAEKLAREYRLSVHTDDVKPFPSWSGNEVSAEQKAANLKRGIERITPGTYLLVEHPAYDDLETQGMGHVGYENVAADRYGVFKALTDKDVSGQIDRRGIRLINYRDLISDK